MNSWCNGLSDRRAAVALIIATGSNPTQNKYLWDTQIINSESKNYIVSVNCMYVKYNCMHARNHNASFNPYCRLNY